MESILHRVSDRGGGVSKRESHAERGRGEIGKCKTGERHEGGSDMIYTVLEKRNSSFIFILFPL